MDENQQKDETTQTQPNNEKQNEPKKLEGEELKEAIKSQIEFYFSQENLSSDHFLVSQMDSNRYVPLTVIETFAKVKSLTTDENLIIEVLSNSKVVEFDETRTKIKPKILENQRCTIILRDILPDTTVEEIETIFTNFEEKVREVKFDIGNTCFVTFSSEKVALSALNFVKTQSYRGSPVQARIKNETILRSCNNVKQPVNHYYTQYPPYQYAAGAWNVPRSSHSDFEQDFNRSNNNNNNNSNNKYQRNSKPSNNNKKPKDSNSNNNNNSSSSNNNSGPNRKSSHGNSNDKRRGGQKKKGNQGGHSRKGNNDFQLGGSYFPPLPTKTNSSENDQSSGEGKKQTWSQVFAKTNSNNNAPNAAKAPKPAPQNTQPKENNQNESSESQHNDSSPTPSPEQQNN